MERAMLWLTQIKIPIPDAQDMQLTNLYNWHQLVWDCCRSDTTESRQFLHRVDNLPDENVVRLFIISGIKTARPSQVKAAWWACKPIREEFLSHQCYRFSLRANPSRKHRHQRLAIVDREEQFQWLKRKAHASGFKIVNPDLLSASGDAVHRFDYRGHTATLYGVDFTGTLTVTDRERFTEAFRTGIGTAKAFGFGMLVLHPVY